MILDYNFFFNSSYFLNDHIFRHHCILIYIISVCLGLNQNLPGNAAVGQLQLGQQHGMGQSQLSQGLGQSQLSQGLGQSQLSQGLGQSQLNQGLGQPQLGQGQPPPAASTSWAAAAGKGLPPSEPAVQNGATNKQLEQLNSVREALFSQVHLHVDLDGGRGG